MISVIRRKLNTLSGKLSLLTITIIGPFTILIACLIFYLNFYSTSYNQIVQNVTAANVYNINFKKSIDSTLYQMVARSITAENVEEEIESENPYDEVEELREVALKLKDTTTADGNVRRLSKLIKHLNNLERRIREISDSVEISGNYDENMEKLNMNIYILTSIIQERIQEYIYYETINMESVRNQIEAEKNIAIRISIVGIVLILLVTIYMAIVIAKSLTIPIKALCKTTEQVAKGNFDTRAESMPGDEITVLTESFNGMVAEIGTLFENIKMEQQNTRNMELKLLQAQINPHFLYNTLDNIIWLAEDCKTDDVVSMVTSLSEFFRTTLSEGRDFISIEEEISHIRSYLEIQKFRYPDILKFQIILPEELKQYKIVKMTLQPIVENAIYHGIKNKRSLGEIKVVVRKEKNSIVIDVIDDGIGMTEEQKLHLEAVMKGKEKHKGAGGFGLVNIQERLHLNYGNGYGVTFESVFNEGSIFTVRIPV